MWIASPTSTALLPWCSTGPAYENVGKLQSLFTANRSKSTSRTAGRNDGNTSLKRARTSSAVFSAAIRLSPGLYRGRRQIIKSVRQVPHGSNSPGTPRHEQGAKV